MNWNKFLKSKRFKYGTISVLLTCGFIALVIVLNLVLSSLNLSVGLSVDLSPEEFCSVGEDSKTILDATFKELPDDFVITVTFCAARDLYDSSALTVYVRELAEVYAEMYDGHIKTQYVDVARDPAAVDKYQNETGTAITANNVIIQGPYHYRILTLDSFFVTNENSELYAFNGELKFTSAFLQCSIEKPQQVAFTTKHGEQLSDTMQLKQIYLDAGFSVTDIDLSLEDIDDSARILIIYKPTSDFVGIDPENPDAVTEIDKITEFVSEYNNLIVFVDSSTPELPNLQEYLNEHWGIGYKPFHTLIDITHSMQGSAGYELLGTYVGESTSFAYQIFQNAVLGSGSRTVFDKAVQLYSDPDSAKKGVVIDTVISTYDTAFSRNTYTKTENGATQTVTEDSKPGEFPLMLMARYMNYKNDDYNYNTQIYQYVLLVASTEFGADDYLTKTYANQSLLLGAERLISSERITPDIPYRKFIDDPIAVETGTATALTIVITAIAPIILIIAGVVVFIKRRHL